MYWRYGTSSSSVGTPPMFAHYTLSRRDAAETSVTAVFDHLDSPGAPLAENAPERHVAPLRREARSWRVALARFTYELREESDRPEGSGEGGDPVSVLDGVPVSAVWLQLLCWLYKSHFPFRAVGKRAAESDLACFAFGKTHRRNGA